MGQQHTLVGKLFAITKWLTKLIALLVIVTAVMSHALEIYDYRMMISVGTIYAYVFSLPLFYEDKHIRRYDEAVGLLFLFGFYITGINLVVCALHMLLSLSYVIDTDKGT